MIRFSGWTVAGILAAVLVGTVHALSEYVLEQRHLGIGPRGWP